MAKPNQHMPHILLVDDTPENLQILADTLPRYVESCDLSFARNGKEALEALDESLPDLILLDVMMPEMNGYEVCEIIKSNPAAAHIPVLFLTAKTESNDVIKGFQAGGADYITKPFNAEELAARVNTHLKIKANADLIAGRNQQLQKLVRILCHDLANPVGALQTLINTTETAEELWETKPYMRLAVDAAQSLIDVVRSMQAMDNQSTPLPLQRAELSVLCSKAVQIVRNQLDKKDISVETQIPAQEFVMVEPTIFVSSVLCNMLTNAAKFSTRGSVIRMTLNREQPDRVTLRITDQGIGIPPAMLANLFDPVSQNSRPGTEGEPGTGFGMALAKNFIERCGGSMTVQSRDRNAYPQDHGTTVIITLPSVS
jgi:DNA-binding response OmpR family regulator